MRGASGASELAGFVVGMTAACDPEQKSRLAALGAEVVPGPVHRDGATEADRWALPTDTGPALHLVDLVCRGALDAITFNAGPAVRNFMAVADRSRRGRNVLAALNHGIVVACAGPDCAATAREEGVEQPRHGETADLAPMIAILRERLMERRRRYLMGSTELVVQGCVVLVDGRPVTLGDAERAVLVKLAERPGTTVSRRVLLRHVWKDPRVEPNILEATITRLRTELGRSGAALESTARRGYRLRAVELAPLTP